MRRAWPRSAVALVLAAALTATACSAAGVRVLGTSGARAPHDSSLDTLVLGSAAAAVTPAPSAPVGGDTPIAEAPERFDGEAKLRPPPPQLRSRPRATQSGTWAVIIGINDYPGTAHDLRSAVPDADDMNRALGALGVPAANRLVITDGQATGRVISAAADWLVARAGPDAVAVFFFAGHVRKVSDRTEAMIGADGSLVTDAQLAARLAPLQARRTWVAMAACFGGGFTEVLRQGVVLTGAAPANERAYEYSLFNRSYMVEYMVRQAMVEGRASDSVQSAYAYARDAIARDFPNRVPVQVDRGAGPIDLRPPGSAPPPRPQAPAQPAPQPAPQEQKAPPSGGGSSGSGGSGTPPPPSRDKCPLSTVYITCDD